MTRCPCGKKKSVLFIQCFNSDCEVGWWHTTCCGFNKDVTKKQLDSMGHWTCPCCVIDVIQIPGYRLGSPCNDLVSKIENQLDDLKSEIEDLKAIKEDLANIGKGQNEAQQLWSDIVGNIPNSKETFASTVAKEVVDQSARVTSDRESRENNIIIFNAEESNNDQASERKQHDQNTFDKICTFVSDAKIPVKKIIRIGKKMAEATESLVESAVDVKKPRPLKVSFSNSFDKRKFFASLNKLKEAPTDLKNIRIQHDLSPEQRKKTKELLALAYEKNQTELPVGFLYKVRGPPHAIKIVKVYQ